MLVVEEKENIQRRGAEVAEKTIHENKSSSIFQDRKQAVLNFNDAKTSMPSTVWAAMGSRAGLAVRLARQWVPLVFAWRVDG
jgi:hypothetical protein